MKYNKKYQRYIKEDIEIPDNQEWDGESDVQNDDLINELISNIQEDGGAYLDWGEFDDTYKNVEDKETAEEIAELFYDKGYFVYYQGDGLDINGDETPDSYTPVAIHILQQPIKLSEYDTEFTKDDEI